MTRTARLSVGLALGFAIFGVGNFQTGSSAQTTPTHGRVYTSVFSGGDFAVDSVWRPIGRLQFSVDQITSGTVLASIYLANSACMGSACHRNWGSAELRATLTDQNGRPTAIESMWLNHAIFGQATISAVTVLSAGPFTFHLAAPDLRPGAYTVLFEGVGHAPGDAASPSPLHYSAARLTASIF